jgi:RND family efflux transporter MFP subunit
MEQTSRLSRQIGSLMAIGTAAGLTDGQLLERFLTCESETAEQAFAALVERHGPMVLRVCRSILPDPHDADDAFQATFLVLVRKTRALWVQDSLGPWLHQVALRTASYARAAAVRRRKHESSAARPVREVPAEEPNDLGPLLHEEVGRLPEPFRVPVVLCDLQGTSHEQAARHLGWPVGTVKSRLARARQRLRERLLRRGLEPIAVVGSELRPDRSDQLLPAALISSTSRAAVRFAASRSVLDGSATILAHGVLSAMAMTRWWKVACVLAVAGVTVSGAGVLAGRKTLAVEPAPQAPAAARSDGDMPIAAASQGPFRLVVSDPGTLESALTGKLISAAEGTVRIVSIVPEFEQVKKGDLVCELDSAAPRILLTNQRITTQSAEANSQNARLTREVAEIALKEYEEGIYLQDRATIQGEIELGKTAIGKTMDRLERIRRAQQKLKERMEKHEETSTDILAEVDLQDRVDSAEQTLRRETLSLGNVESKLKRLETYTKPKTVRDLTAEVEKARAVELSKMQILQLEKAKERRLEGQILASRLIAPNSGIVVYNDHSPRDGNPDRIEKGAWVREGQLIVQIMSLELPMQLNARIGEPMVDRLEVGQRAKVRIDAFPEESFTGVVMSIAPRPDSAAFARSGRKIYPTHIKLDNSTKRLMPGMNGRAEITIVERENALTVPIDALLEYQGKYHVAVKQPGGGFEWREVKVGDADDRSKLAEITQGLKPGEQVALKPIDLMSEFEKRQKGIGVPAKNARRKPVDPTPSSPASR